MGFVENCRKSDISFGNNKQIACWPQAVEEGQLELYHSAALLVVVLF